MMNFALVLTLLSAFSGVLILADKFWLAKKRKPGTKQGKLIEFAYSYFPVFFAVLLLRSFLIEPFRIPSGSLEPTLQVGDFVAVNKFAYGIRLPVIEKLIIPFHSPKTGDIVVFRWPAAPELDFIKRVIGVPHDKIGYHDKVLTINGKRIAQHFIEYTTDESSNATVAKYEENLAGVRHDIYVRPGMPSYDFDIEVPEGSYFVMGDNRDDSADSRFWGFVADEYLRGQAFAVWMSWNSHTGSVRWSHIGHLIH